jgi:valyl-tRNA synthetase
MLGDTGVAVHPDDPRYRHLIGKTVRLPIVGRSIPIVGDAYADPAKGTGAVKITPAHDFNDWEVGRRAGLRVINVMSTTAGIALKGNADFAEGCPAEQVAAAVEMFDGRDRYEVRDALVTLARDEGWLDGIDADRHMVPHGDRSKAAIEPLLTDQWFVDTAQIVQPAIDAVRNGETRILPESDSKVYFHWLENIEPWCISRQLWWGHQVPVWYGPDLAQIEDPLGDHAPKAFCAATEAEVLEQALAYYGQDVEVRIEAEGGTAGISTAPASDGTKALAAVTLTRDPDVLDTWFSSGLWPIGTLGWPDNTPELQKYFPTSVLITGFDIIFFWVARMMMMHYAVVGQRPFDTVYVHALVRDEKGKKMSKSLGNVLDPIDLVDEFGADAVRFTLTAMAAMGRDLKLSTQRIAGYRNFGTKLWNAARFAEMNGALRADVPDTTRPTPTAAVNRWILGETARTRETVDAALAAFRFDGAAAALYGFVWGKVCDWYVEFAKPLLSGPDPVLRAETQATMAWVLDQCLILLHPIMPFVTEELWQTTGPRAKMLIHADWPDHAAADLADPAADAEMEWVIGLIEEVRSARAQMHVPAGLTVAMVHTGLDAAATAAWERNEALIRRLARIEGLSRVEALPRGSVTIAVPGGTLGLPLEGIIDVAGEQSRLEKSLVKLDREIAGLAGRLDNPKFVASAPEEVVEEVRETLAERQREAAALRAALGRLAELA